MIDSGTLIMILLGGCVAILFVKAHQQHRDIEEAKKAIVGTVAIVRILASLPVLFVKTTDGEDQADDLASAFNAAVDRIRREQEREKDGES